jgi:hypothetical protein
VKVLGELEPVESKLFVSLQSMSVSAEAFLQLVCIKRPEMLEEMVALDFTDGVRTGSLLRLYLILVSCAYLY